VGNAVNDTVAQSKNLHCEINVVSVNFSEHCDQRNRLASLALSNAFTSSTPTDEADVYPRNFPDRADLRAPLWLTYFPVLRSGNDNKRGAWVSK
jgi:hypothetical protein